MFWYKILPLILSVRDIIGCQYCFLFAADSSDDGTLENYYKTILKFKRMDKIGVSKPKYDFMCIPMLCEISELEIAANNFFENFNVDGDIIA